MGTMILISVVAIIVAIVGSFVIWRLDVARADEIERPSAPTPRASSAAIEGPVAVRPIPLPVTPPAPNPAA